jgi:hypothetical protein
MCPLISGSAAIGGPQNQQFPVTGRQLPAEKTSAQWQPAPEQPLVSYQSGEQIQVATRPDFIEQLIRRTIAIVDWERREANFGVVFPG